MRLYVVGTDTGVGKTRVTAALASARRTTIVKLVQTGLAPEVPGDAEEAAAIADAARGALASAGRERVEATPWRELARFLEPADPWNAALVAGARPLACDELVRTLDACAPEFVLEGSGGAAVPLDAMHSISDVAHAAGCDAIVVVGLRLGCISHALLTLGYLTRLGMRVRGAITTEAFGAVSDAYRHQVDRVLVANGLQTRHIAFESDAVRSVANAAPHLLPFLENP